LEILRFFAIGAGIAAVPRDDLPDNGRLGLPRRPAAAARSAIVLDLSGAFRSERAKHISWRDPMVGAVKVFLAGVAGTALVVASAQAGGFSRGTADTDILFEEGNFNMRAGATIVSPQRGYSTINGVAAADGNYTNSYVVPTGAVKLNLTDYARCAGTYTQPYGGSSSYGPQAIAAGLADGSGLVSRQFTTDEFGLTCAAMFDNVGSFGEMGSGRLSLIGGVFIENFNFVETVQFQGAVITAGLLAAGQPALVAGAVGGTLNGTQGALSFNGGYNPGYRIGLAYEVPEIAARVQLLYRSQVNHTPAGTFVTAADALAGGSGVTRAAGTLPQSLELRAQTGVAPGTLVFGSVKWTDWSVLQRLNYTVTGGPLPGVRNLEFFWKDGWTVTGGVGREFNDWLSGSVSLTWDQGVSTTEDVFTDTWTLATGVQIKGERASLSLGGAISHLAGGAVSAEAAVGAGGPGDTFAYTVGSDWSYAIGGRFAVNW
jgi:long-chain fatty acid transport protein